MKGSRRIAIWVLAAVGLVASATSLFTHYKLLADPGYTSFCDINAAVSCQAAYLSPYGSFMGRPVALFGVAWFGFVLVLAFIDTIAAVALRDGVLPYLRLSSIAAAASVLYLAFAAFIVLNVVCLLCLITYVAVLGLLGASTMGVPMKQIASLPRHLVFDARAILRRPMAAAALLLFMSGAALALVLFPSESALGAAAVEQTTQAPPRTSVDERTELEQVYRTLPRYTVPVTSDGAVVVVVKFADLQCPPCRALYFGLRPVLAKYQQRFPGAVKFVSKDFPLEPECNPGVPRAIHPAACEAAAAVRLAGAHGKSEMLEEWFYGHQGSMSPAAVREAARVVGGVTPEEFERGYARAIGQVRADAGLAWLLTVSQTPTFFVNGRKLPSIRPEDVDLAIEIELRRAGLLKPAQAPAVPHALR